jgi:hypothetical protein
LPASAADVRVSVQGGMFAGDAYLRAAITAGVRGALAALGFAASRGRFAVLAVGIAGAGCRLVSATAKNDADTFFGAADSAYLVARYERRHLFFKRHVY